MAVKIVGLIRLKDKQAFEIYRNQVGATVEQYGGYVATRGAVEHTYWNELSCGDFSAFVELQFPSAEDAERWSNSPEYLAIIPVRNKAMDLTLFRVDT